MSAVIGLRDGTVLVRAYTTDWPRLFREERERLQACIGDLVRDIQHIGSTAVPGLDAKPVLDIGVAVDSFEGAFSCIPLLESIGYVYEGELGIPRRHYFWKGRPRTHQLHMNERRSDDWKRTIAFRDTLRRRADLALAYAALKRDLARKHPENLAAYTEGKTPFIEDVLKMETDRMLRED
jgi:GrpB-like predicted nucleotidyltransferase (UPF0157 family)